MKRKSFVLYTDSLEVINELEDAQIANLFRAILAKAKGEDFELSKLERIAFIPIKNYLERDAEDWESEVEKRREAGRLGGLAKAKKRKQKVAKLASASDPKQPLANLADNVTENDNVTDTENDIKKYITISNFVKDKDLIIKKIQSLYPDKNAPKAYEDFVGYIQSRNTKYKDFYLAFANWVREDRFNKYNIAKTKTREIETKLNSQKELEKKYDLFRASYLNAKYGIGKWSIFEINKNQEIKQEIREEFKRQFPKLHAMIFKSQ